MGPTAGRQSSGSCRSLERISWCCSMGRMTTSCAEGRAPTLPALGENRHATLARSGAAGCTYIHAGAVSSEKYAPCVTISGLGSKRGRPFFSICREGPLKPREGDGNAESWACCRRAIRPGSWGAATVSTVSSSGGRAGTLDPAEGQAPPRRSRGSQQLRGGSTRGGVRGAFRSASGGE